MVQYIRTYSTKYAEPRCEHATQFRIGSSPPKLLDRRLHQILHNIVALVALFNDANTWHYPIPFLNANRRQCGVCHFFCRDVAMATHGNVPTDIEKRSRSIICTQNAFIRWNDCENRSSRSWDNLCCVRSTSHLPSLFWQHQVYSPNWHSTGI